MGVLPNVSDRPAVPYPHFPTHWQAVVWRNWGLIPADRIAAALRAGEADVRRAAGELGLDPSLEANPEWLTRGYLTVIRENWHLCTFQQITTLLGIDEERLAFLLKEDDFLWHKMGQVKPAVEAPRLAPLSEEEARRTEAIRAYLAGALPYPDFTRDTAFGFVPGFTRVMPDAERRDAVGQRFPNDPLRTVYSYFALYGDPLLDDLSDPFPEALLAEYAKMGVKGVWLQGILYQLVEFPFAPEMSAGCGKRMEKLRALIKRADKFGIGVYLYMNEPRAMDDAFFRNYPYLRGIREGDFYSMCTSRAEVRAYLENAMYILFSEAKGLAGFFTITMSENLTNCVSRHGADGACPICKERRPEEIIAEVNNVMARGAHRADPKAKAVAWNWAWGEEWADKVPALLTEKQIVQCTSEERLPISIGGAEGTVVDYTMSLCGPGPKAKAVWKAALDAGHEVSAKVQFNNTWELSALPWLPVFDKVAEHVGNLKAAGVRHLQMSWTLGGYPSPNLKLAGYLMDNKRGTVPLFLEEWLGKELGAAADKAQKAMSEAFAHFPFHVGVVYTAPMNYGPMAPFFEEETGWRATMIGFPYDALDTWRSIYSREAFAEQFRKLTEGWRAGAEALRPYLGRSEAFDDLARMARAALCHFDSTYHHIQYVMAREAGDRAAMRAVLAAERETVKEMIGLRREDSRLGYEASNHYFYSMQDLLEKLINLKYLEDRV